MTAMARNGSKVGMARAFLRRMLRDAARPAGELEVLSARLGISKRTLARAKAQLEVVSERVGYGAEGRWVWRLPRPSSCRRCGSEGFEEREGDFVCLACGRDQETRL